MLHQRNNNSKRRTPPEYGAGPGGPDGDEN